MTKKLRIRFMVFSMLALLIMQCLVIFFSAQRSYGNMVSKTDALISTIKNTYPDNANVDARYFVVTINREDDTKDIDLNHISSVRYEEAQEYARTVLNGNSKIGFVDTFRYQVFKEPKGMTIIFLSRSYGFDSLRSSILSSILFSSVGMCVMFVLLLAVSYWVTHPVEAAYKKQQQFITSASHEFGTPLTVIKADTDILLSDDPDNEWLQDIGRQTARLTEMTHKLITLAKMDEQGNQVKRIPFPISDLAEDVTGSYLALAQSEQKAYSVVIEPYLTYNGEENMIRQLLTILLDNAFKYCPSGGSVDFAIKKAAQGIHISVCNSVENLDEDDLSRLFERFYRSSQARGSGKKGYGLGLSIADSIVKCHKSKITAKALEKNKIQISVVLK